MRTKSAIEAIRFNDEVAMLIRKLDGSRRIYSWRAIILSVLNNSPVLIVTIQVKVSLDSLRSVQQSSLLTYAFGSN